MIFNMRNLNYEQNFEMTRILFSPLFCQFLFFTAIHVVVQIKHDVKHSTLS